MPKTTTDPDFDFDATLVMTVEISECDAETITDQLEKWWRSNNHGMGKQKIKVMKKSLPKKLKFLTKLYNGKVTKAVNKQ